MEDVPSGTVTSSVPDGVEPSGDGPRLEVEEETERQSEGGGPRVCGTTGVPVPAPSDWREHGEEGGSRPTSESREDERSRVGSTLRRGRGSRTSCRVSRVYYGGRSGTSPAHVS